MTGALNYIDAKDATGTCTAIQFLMQAAIGIPPEPSPRLWCLGLDVAIAQAGSVLFELQVHGANNGSRPPFNAAIVYILRASVGVGFRF